MPLPNSPPMTVSLALSSSRDLPDFNVSIHYPSPAAALLAFETAMSVLKQLEATPKRRKPQHRNPTPESPKNEIA